MSGRTPLLLVPGVLCDASLWAHQTRHLTDIAEMTIVDTVRDDSLGAIVERALESAPPKFALAGLSMGGYVALEFWRWAPKRITKLRCWTLRRGRIAMRPELSAWTSSSRRSEGASKASHRV